MDVCVISVVSTHGSAALSQGMKSLGQKCSCCLCLSERESVTVTPVLSERPTPPRPCISQQCPGSEAFHLSVLIPRAVWILIPSLFYVEKAHC